MVQIELLKQLLRTCVRKSWLEELRYRASGETTKILIAVNSDRQQQEKVEVAKKDFGELTSEEKLQGSLTTWGQTSSLDQRQFWEEIYAMFSKITLKPEIVAAVILRFIDSENTNPVILFKRLEDFYCRWCNGEFIDAAPSDNLPQKQMLQLQAQNVMIGLRQVDINTGLNVMILLLEIHKRLRSQNHHLQTEISFYPSAKPDNSNFFTSKLLRVINYSDSIEIGNFSNVVGAFLDDAQLNGVYLGDANLTGVNFSSANLMGAYLGNANLTGLQATKVNLSNADLSDANLSGANLREGNLIGSDLTHCNFSGADLSGVDLSGADLSNGNLSGANLNGANLSNANLTSANLRDAILSGANLKNAILFGANLSESNLIGAEISYADLCRADLSGANLRNSTLKGTNLSDCILFSTNLKEAILIAADLSYAKLNGANLEGANLQQAIIVGADLSNVNLSQGILRKADLSGVTLNQANLNGADLSAANLQDVKWSENVPWENAHGLDKAVNLPEALKEISQ
ncbi:MAG: pentapeptide repeat-containing protein [Richelia sp. RM2_1_2]|nr:pentapeptide repeat-containing protein [Richelia sp. SM2_1_7]NJM21598.1 pentapeptide repeat-containing protein [Richelia sp. SM1_7_0]NJN07277.1 pentapeptide repeat-containing protein [Richelia sp. RM1_1_1]NJO30095.1 pentapeptide repeat-containing protein [Richelia sp. SL_2_1]NJO61286.1 pentapeptide repeat-containing protein [Richelia sp. RM2_1_2]